jgi:hypothetical protein
VNCSLPQLNQLTSNHTRPYVLNLDYCSGPIALRYTLCSGTRRKIDIDDCKTSISSNSSTLENVEVGKLPVPTTNPLNVPSQVQPLVPRPVRVQEYKKQYVFRSEYSALPFVSTTSFLPYTLAGFNIEKMFFASLLAAAFALVQVVQGAPGAPAVGKGRGKGVTSKSYNANVCNSNGSLKTFLLTEFLI